MDTGAQHSVLLHSKGPISAKRSWVQGATGNKQYSWTTRRTVDLGIGRVTHSFLIIPECPYPLLGRDLLSKVGAQIHFQPEGPTITDNKGRLLQILTMKLEDEYKLYEQPSSSRVNVTDWVTRFPQAWAETAGMGMAKNRPPVLVELKATATPITVRQYPMSREAKDGIRPHIQRLLDLGILIRCQSAWNTPLLPVKKPGTNDYRPVQDLREVNKRVADLHPTVPNPYNLLSTLPPQHTWYTVLDLKDAFFCLKLSPLSQPYFAFEWKDPTSGMSGQLTWTRLPQGFKNSPTIFDEALHQDLALYRESNPQVTLLQYVDDILLAAETQEDCIKGTEKLLTELGTLGYRASAKKAQICQQQVSYLGYLLKGGQRWLTESRKDTVAQIPAPKNARQVREFLGMAGFCRLWIPGFAELAAPLYPLTKNSTPFVWGDKEQRAFDQIKRALLSAPALGLPDVTKPFHLYVAENKGIAKGVLTQKLGPWNRPVAYLSKKLDPVASGWPTCLKIIAAVAVLVKDADKLTLGQNLTITAPHALENVVRQPPDRWLTNARMTHYQTLLLNSDRIKFAPATGLNPATLLPDPDLEGSTIIHDCQEVLAAAHGSRPDLMDLPLPDADFTWFTDGSSFLEEGKRRTGAAVVDGKQVIWAAALPQGTSAQRAELIALTRALEMAENKKVNIYTDSRYAFATAHIHGAIYQQRGLLTSGGKEIKNKDEIVALLTALMLPTKVSIIHCLGHQKGNTPIIRGNNMADQVAREIASGEVILGLSDKVPEKPGRDEEVLPATTKGTLSPQQAESMLQQMHRWTHLGTKKMIALLQKAGYETPGITKLAEQIVQECVPCQQVNVHKGKLETGKRLRGDRPGTYWEVDFTEVRPGRYGNKYLLVFIDTFSGWIEAFPTKKETAAVVAKKILEEIFPRFGAPKVIGSDNGPAFVAQVSQDVARYLGTDWKLHCAYRPQSSGQVERMNRTLKETLTKLSLETGGTDWTVLLPLALFRVRNTPSRYHLTPFEVLYGAPPPLLTLGKEIKPDCQNNTDLYARLLGLQLVQKEIWSQLAEAYQPGTPGETHPFQVGDSVYVRRHRTQTLEPRWKGPYTVLLTTPTAIKVDGIAAWIHASHVKAAPATASSGWRAQRTNNPLKLKLLRT
nr:uncharacterized protein LOC132419261 [Delphinus delphis]